jgi:hypothetical protein
LFFQLFIAHQPVPGKTTISHKFTALDSIHRYIESRPVSLTFTETIQQAINDQAIKHLEYCNSVNACADPRKGLKDVMSTEEKLRIIDRILEADKFSNDVLLAFGWGCNAGVHGSSSRRLSFSDLNTSVGFGPESVER